MRPALHSTLLALFATALVGASASFAVAAGTASSEPASEPAPGPAKDLNCAKYTVYFIDPDTKFIAPPVPIEEHAQKIFCSESPSIERLTKLISQTKPIKKRADLGRGRIKIVPTQAPDNAMLILDNGEAVYNMNTYLIRRKPLRQIVGQLTSEAAESPERAAKTP